MSAQLVLDTTVPTNPFGVGVRVGVNTSNLSNNMQDVIPGVQLSTVNWKAGFDGGAVVDIKIRNYIVLQPGFFFETRSDKFQRVTVIGGESTDMMLTEGTHTSTYFKIPVLASLRFLIGYGTEWQIDFGPYFATGIGGNEKYSTIIAGEPIVETRYKRSYFGDDGIANSFDWGFKMGMGLAVKRHYYVGIHYEAGCRNILKPTAYTIGRYPTLSGHTKAWDFTVGYNF
jgi:hypothetical protein